MYIDLILIDGVVRSRELVLILDNRSNDNSNRILYVISSLLLMCGVLRCFVGRSISLTCVTTTMFRLWYTNIFIGFSDFAVLIWVDILIFNSARTGRDCSQ